MSITDTARLKAWIGRRERLYNFLRWGRNIYWCFEDAFRYGPLSFNDNRAEQAVLDSQYDTVDHAALMLKQRKYDYTFPHLRPGMRILDLACGAGELSEILGRRFERIHYVGADYDANRVRIGRSLGRNVHPLDCSDEKALKDFIRANGPFDAVFCMYAFYFFPMPEAFLTWIHGAGPKVFLGCFNSGHWSYRLRYVFGRAPRPSIHYSQRQTNYSEMKRFWTLRDHKFVFRSLHYKGALIAVKSDATSIHYPPRRFLLPSLCGKGFVFLLEPDTP